mgnify:CR=1 FL=1|tara:strand:- start:66 stop:407 length:342 start_codon:yes stop_codon:yes gene_type:complete
MPAKVLDNVLLLAEQLQVLRDALDTPIHLTNAYRCIEHNEVVQKEVNKKYIAYSSKSQHLLGKAADIKGLDTPPEHVESLILCLIEEGLIQEGGLHAYKTFVHYDNRGKKARW